MFRLVRPCLSLVVVASASIATADASTIKTVCASGCDYSDLQTAINAASGSATSPAMIQVQLGVLSVDAPIIVNNKHYLTIAGVGDGASVVQASSTWFSQAITAPSTPHPPNDQFLTISNSDHITLRDITIDALTNTPSGLTITQDLGGIAGVFLQVANPVVIVNTTIKSFWWGLRDAFASDTANNNYLEITNSRVESQYVAAWLTGGSTWYAWNSEFGADGDLTASTPYPIIIGLYVTGAIPTGAKNVFIGWGCYFYAESSTSSHHEGVSLLNLNVSDQTSFVGSTIHAKSTATSGTPSVESFWVSGGHAANVDVSGSEIIYEGPPTLTSGLFVGVYNTMSYITVNLTGTSIIDRARDDSTTPPTLAGSTHKDIYRPQSPSGSKPSPVHLVGSRGQSMTGHSTSVPQSLDTVESQAGTVQLGAGGSATVTLPATLPSNKYRVAISVNANETVWVSSKTATGFTLQSSNGSSTATVDWIVRF